MRVAVLPADQGGCGAYRMRWPAEALIAQGHDVVIDAPVRCAFSARFRGLLPPAGVRVLEADCDADVVVVQRPMHRQWLDVIPLLRAKGIRVVVELDDCFDRISRANKAWTAAEPHWLEDDELADLPPTRVKRRLPGWSHCPDIESASNRENIRRALPLADHLIVSTPALAKHYGHLAPSVSVVRNCIPGRYVRFGERHLESDPVRIGWTGSVESHPHDLQVTGGALARVAAPFVAVGTGEGVAARLGRPVNGTTGWVPLESYAEAYSYLDVAICPLVVDTFNSCKSWLKPLEAAAVGAIPIMSPTPEYLELHGQGVGLVARTPAEWERHAKALITSPRLRSDLRAKGLEVARRWTIEGNAEQWWDAWTARALVPA